MNAITLLDQQHREVEALFEKVRHARNAETRQRYFLAIADALAVHCAIEEKIFYPAVMDAKTEEILLESVEEHLAAKRVIADLLELDPDDRNFEAKLSVLEEEITHHIKEERRSVFPKAKKILDRSQLEELGSRMESMVSQLEGEEPRDEVPNEIARAAELPEL